MLLKRCSNFMQKILDTRYASFLTNRKLGNHSEVNYPPGCTDFSLSIKPQKPHIKYLSTIGKYDFSAQFDDLVPNTDLSFLEWGTTKESIIQTIRSIDKTNADAVILQKLMNRKCLTSAKSYANYLQQTNRELNLGCMGKILKLYYTRASQENLSEDEERHILQLYKEVTAKYPILEHSIAHNFICGLSITKEWREIIKIIETIKLYSTPTHATYSVVVSTAFDNNECDIAFKVLDELVRSNCIPADTVYISWIRSCINRHQSKESLLSLLEVMLNFCDKNDFVLSVDVVNDLCKTFTDLLDWKGEFTSIKKSGKCTCCKGSLDAITFDQKEYEHLKKEFYSKVIVGRNIFIKTFPEEIDKFTKFIKETGPYDMVIDGLNVSYSISGKASNKSKSNLLLKVVKSLLKDHKKILFIGRKHMLRWPKEDMDLILKKTTPFLLENLSQDDPFLLYAALSNLKTCFLSRDFMRGHQVLLDEETQVIFKRWQQSHQHILIYAGENGNVSIEKPMKYSPSTQKNKSWHIPYNNLNQLQCPYNLGFPEMWLCLQPKE